MSAREMQMEFERRIQLMNPEFKLNDKLTSDTIFSFLNAYTQRYIKNNYLQEDVVQDNSRALKKVQDALKVINLFYLKIISYILEVIVK